MKRLKKGFTKLLACLMILTTFVGCSSEITSQAFGPATVSFAPSISKALNQNGEVIESTESADDYHWEYYCSEVDFDENSTATDFKPFSDKTSSTDTGLGTVVDLIKGKGYYFALRGYSTDTNTLLWQGKTESKVLLNSKSTLVTLVVNPKGKGELRFEIKAPVATPKNIENGALKAGCEKDKFVVTIVPFDEPENPVTTGTDLTRANVVYNSVTDYFTYSSVNSDAADFVLDSGYYLITVSQYTWKSSAYTPVAERSQALIVKIGSGIKTIVKGSLDSTTLVAVDATIDGIEFGEGDVTGMEMLPVTVKAENGEDKILLTDERVEVLEGKYVIISNSGSSFDKIYYNGLELDKTSTTDGFINRPNGTKSLVKLSGTDLLAYGGSDYDYLLTVTSGTSSASFTIVGKSVDAATVKASSGTKSLADFTTPLEISNSSSTVTATIPTAAKQDFDALFPAQYSSLSDSEKKVVVSLNVKEEEKSASSTVFEISLEATTKVISGGIENYSSTTNVSSLSDYVVATVQLESGLSNVSVIHAGTTMNKKTSLADFNSATSATDTGNAGFSFYDETDGKLWIKTRSFSPFTITYESMAARIGDKCYGSLAAAIKDAAEGDTIVLLRNITNAVGMSVSNTNSFTIDFDGYTYSVSKPGAGSSGTETSAFQLLKGGHITFKNGTINAKEDNLTLATVGKNIKRLFQVYRGLTLEDMTIDGTNVYENNSLFEFVLGSSSITGKTSITAKPGVKTINIDTWRNAVYKDGCQLTINTTGSVGDIYYYSEGTDDPYTPSVLTIENGVFGSVSSDNLIDENISISGGKFYEKPSDEFVKNGYVAKQTDGYWKVSEFMAAQIGNKNYKTLQAAINDASAGSEIVLQGNVDENITVAQGKNIVLDLAGYSINGKAVTETPALRNNGTLVIKDSSSDKSGTIKREDAGTSGYYVIANEGTLTIKQAKVTNGTGSSEIHAGATLITNGEYDINSTAVLNIEGGDFNQENFNVIKNSASNSTVNISGGVFVSNQKYVVLSYGKLNISGGSLTGPISTRAFKAGEEQAVGATVITNGEFNGPFYVEEYTNCPADTKPSLTVSGGSFTSNCTLNVGVGNGTTFTENNEKGTVTLNGYELVSNIITKSAN